MVDLKPVRYGAVHGFPNHSVSHDAAQGLPLMVYGQNGVAVTVPAAYRPSELTANNAEIGIDEAEALLRQAVPSAEYVFIEPDIDRAV